MDYLYTLAFLKRDDQILMINRVKQPWLGMWNGVGGKRQVNESAMACIIREIEEETQIKLNESQVFDKGIVTWNDQFEAKSSGLHLFFVQLPADYVYETPVNTVEGILDFKPIKWVSNVDNLGVAYNIPFFIDNVVHKKERYHYHCIFDKHQLLDVKVETI